MAKFTIQDCININKVIETIKNICDNTPCKDCPLHNIPCGTPDIFEVLSTLYDVAINDVANDIGGK